MNFIGSIIEECRNVHNMSRNELSKDICSEKYIYLIEKDKRTPSANMIKLLGDRLGIDLFSYYEYLDCINPLAVKKYMEEFNMYRAKLEPELLYQSTNEAMKLPDFNKEPWIFETQINIFFYSIYAKYEYKESIIEISKFLKDIEPKYSRGEYVANAYIMLSSCYIFLGEFSNAKKASLSAYEIMGNKYKEKSYEKMITNIKINIMALSYLLGEYDIVIREANEILKYKYEAASLDRIHYAFFYLAFAHHKMGLQDEAIENFKKGIYLGLTDYNVEDIKYIVMQDAYLELINNEKVNKEVVNEFKKKYNITE